MTTESQEAPELSPEAADAARVVLSAATDAPKPVVPTDPFASVFQPYLVRLRALADMPSEQAGSAAVQARGTQRALWYDMLRGSGMVPAEHDAAELFVQHTFLVVAARAVIRALEGGAGAGAEAGASTARATRALALSEGGAGAGAGAGAADGFVSWIGSTPGGGEWLSELAAAADSFDWRARPRDVLRSMYEAVISPAHRKSFGEYYTPDWLAEMVVERVLDPAWCERAVAAARRSAGVPAGVGVLDPACGSGTFLFHAVRRICEFAAEWTPQQQADLAARLVSGIDIHPVAVEIARATLLRALPAVPSEGADGLRVHQGDSLSSPLPNDPGGLHRAAGILAFRTPRQRRIDMPVAFARLPGLSQRLRHFVDACFHDGPLPAHLTEDLDASEGEALLGARHQLADAISAEGNGVWARCMRNQMSTTMLEESKVDRIVANPPWVRMSEIQVKDRRESFDSMTRDLGLYASRRSRSPAAAAGSFDIAALFVLRCEDLYLADSGAAAGWVLNRASLTADNWARFREQRRGAGRVDLTEVRPAPFSGAKSAVWFTRSGDNGPGAGDDGQHTALGNAAGATFDRGDRWQDVRPRLCERDAAADSVAGAASAASDYVTGRTGDTAPRAGANLRPHCLVLVGRRDVGPSGRVAVRTAESRQSPWRRAGTITAEVMSEWLADAVFSQQLLVGCLSTTRSTCVVPVDGSGGLDPVPSGDFWKQAEAVYASFKGRGRTTPDTLAGMLDYQGRLSAQMKRRSRWTVVYNKSGQLLRAARTREAVLVNDACYWLRTAGGDEAAYLAAILNCDALQGAYRASRRSDRDFHTHFWHRVPVPAFDRDDDAHRRLARLGKRLEIVATEVRDSPELAGAGQVKVCERIRHALRADGVAGRIDRAARQLLPDHAAPGDPLPPD